MKHYVVAVISLVAGLSMSLAAALLNGYSPCDVFGLSKPDVVIENERLMAEAKTLKGEIDRLNHESNGIVEELRKKLGKQKDLNEKLSKGIIAIGEINKKGVSNEQKIQEISAAISNIGSSLVSGIHK